MGGLRARRRGFAIGRLPSIGWLLAIDCRRKVFGVSAIVCLGVSACAPARRHESATALRALALADVVIVRSPTPAAFFVGSDDLFLALPALPLPALAADGSVRPQPVRLAPIDEAVRRAARSAGRRDAVTVYAFGVAFFVPGPPSRYAERALDAGHEQRALGADEVVEVARSGRMGREARWLAIALLNLGEGPFRYDFRWTLRVAREDLPDGRILLRYDLDEQHERQRVSLFRGVAIIEPTASGALVREAFVVGSPLAPPPFLSGKARDAVRDLLVRRWARLSDG